MENFLLILAGDIARRLLGFLAVAFLARKIGAEGFGIINIGFAVLSYTLMASSAGLHSLGTREIAKGNSDDIVGDIIGLRILLSGAAILLTLCVVLFTTNSQIAIVIVIFNFTLIPQAFFLDWYYQGKERMGNIVASKILGAAVYVLSLYFLIQPGGDLRRVGYCVVLGDIVAAAGFVIQYVRSHGMPRIRFNLSIFGDLLRQSIPMATGSMLGNLSINFPAIAIGYFMTNTDVGIYSAAVKLVFFLLMFDRVIGALLLPASARIHKHAPEDFVDRLQMTIKWIIIIALSCSLGAVLIAKKIILLIYGGQYIGSVLILQIGIWYFFFTLVHTVFATGLIAINKEKLYGKIMTVSTAVYVITIVLGIKYFGVAGAVGAVVFSELLTVILLWQSFNKFIAFSLPPGLLKIFVSAVIMSVIVFFLSDQPVFLDIVLGAAVYIILLFITRAVTSAELLTLIMRET
ncbi:MAG: oligosaccharide flippase family protein [Bacteroidota bacterium]